MGSSPSLLRVDVAGPLHFSIVSDELQALVGGFRRGELQGYLVSDADAVAFQGDDFFGMVGDDADIGEAQVNQDLRADAAFVLHQALAGRFAIELAAGMKMDLRERPRSVRGVNTVTAAGMMQIEKHAAVLFSNFFQGTSHEVGAITRS